MSTNMSGYGNSSMNDSEGVNIVNSEDSYQSACEDKYDSDIHSSHSSMDNSDNSSNYFDKDSKAEIEHKSSPESHSS